MQTLCSSEKQIPTYQTTRCHSPEDHYTSITLFATATGASKDSLWCLLSFLRRKAVYQESVLAGTCLSNRYLAVGRFVTIFLGNPQTYHTKFQSLISVVIVLLPTAYQNVPIMTENYEMHRLGCSGYCTLILSCVVGGSRDKNKGF